MRDAKLRADEAIEMLRELEWSATGDFSADRFCPVCAAAPQEGHDDCRLAWVLYQTYYTPGEGET